MESVAPQIAAALIEGFDKHYRLFRGTTALAKERFEAAEWRGVQRAVQRRIRFYKNRVQEAVDRLRDEFDAASLDVATWQEVKLHYIGLLVDHKRPELAETFFNSVITRILQRTYSDNDLIFVRAAVSTEYIPSDPPTYRSYYPASPEIHRRKATVDPSGEPPRFPRSPSSAATTWRPGKTDLRACFRQVFLDFEWTLPFADLERDLDLLLDRVHEPTRTDPNFQLQVLGSPFYRNKAAYVLGKIVNGNDEQPFLVAVLHDEQGRLELDTILLEPEQIDALFSLSRAYFMVDMDVPSAYVQFLRTMMPARARSELYTMVGLGGQGKTLFYRDLLHHLHHSQDLFVEAPGIRGQVMHVFTLPSYPYVFKVIRDVFGPAKNTDRETVKSKFAMVKDVDRVGRMADALEFTELALPRSRFSDELLEQLRDLAPSVIDETDDTITLRHCYVERRMIPLNIFLEDATEDEVESVVTQYGEAIRELAIANIFPGDFLWRNFGVTRLGRVVFYDYDEIDYLTACNFRRIPPAPTPEAELSDEPWYSVARNDVFPEEFAVFLLGDKRVRDVFVRRHADLLEPEFWQDCQRRVEAGEIQDFFPYPESLRFRNGTGA